MPRPETIVSRTVMSPKISKSTAPLCQPHGAVLSHLTSAMRHCQAPSRRRESVPSIALSRPHRSVHRLYTILTNHVSDVYDNEMAAETTVAVNGNHNASSSNRLSHLLAQSSE